MDVESEKERRKGGGKGERQRETEEGRGREREGKREKERKKENVWCVCVCVQGHASERKRKSATRREEPILRSFYKRTHKLTRPPLRRGVYRRELSTERDALFGPSTLSGLARKPTGPTWPLLYHYHPPPPALLPHYHHRHHHRHHYRRRRRRRCTHWIHVRVSLMCHHYQRIGNHHHRHHLLPTGRLYLSSRLPRTRQRKRESEREGE